MDAALEVPSIVVGLGPFGVKVVKRLVAERAEALSVAGEKRADEHPLLVVERSGDLDPEEIAAAVLAHARAVLSHARLASRRDVERAEGLTRLHVFVIAHLGEASTRERLGGVLAAVERRLLGELGPIFEAFRTGAERNLVVLPITAMPHPAATSGGADVTRAVRDLCSKVAATGARKRAVPQLFLIEDVAEYSVFSEDELAQCVRNFVTLLLYSLSAVRPLNELLYGQEPDQPLATFVCSVAELSRSRLAAYAVDRVAIEVVDEVLGDEGKNIVLEDIDAIEEVELASLDAPEDADRDILELLNRYGPEIHRDPDPKWWESSESIRERYGPDRGDPSSVEAQKAPDPPVGWALGRMREIEEAWRLLQRRRFEDVISKERERIQEARDSLLERIRKRVDITLWADPSPSVFRKATTLVSHMERAVSLRLEDAIRDRDAALPVPPPSFDRFREAHARFFDETRRKPDLRRLALYGTLFVIGVVLFCPIALRALAEAMQIHESDWQSPFLRDYGWLTSLVVSSLGTGAFLGYRYRRAYLAMRDAFVAMYEALEQTVTGLRDSVLEYFSTRLRLAREIARVEALLAVRASIIGDAERLTLLDRAVRRARGHLLERLRSIGVDRNERGEEDISRMLGARGESLCEALAPPETARFFDRLVPPEGRDSRVRDVLHSMARDQRYAHRWREEVPFTSLEALRSAALPHAKPLAEWDPFGDAECAEATAQQIASFARRQARSLNVALNISGHEMRDVSGVTRAFTGEVIVPPPAYDEVRRRLGEEGAGGRVRIPAHAGVERDRAYYIVTVGDIAVDAVASLQPDPAAP
jgi:hypothetical protein